MSSKCFITFLNTTAQSERSGSNPRLLPRCLRSSHASLLRRKVAREAQDPQLSFDLFSARHAVAKGKEPFDARPLCRNAGFSQQVPPVIRAEEHTSELRSPCNLVC